LNAIASDPSDTKARTPQTLLGTWIPSLVCWVEKCSTLTCSTNIATYVINNFRYPALLSGMLDKCPPWSYYEWKLTVEIYNVIIFIFQWPPTKVPVDNVLPILNSNWFELKIGKTSRETIVFRKANYPSWGLLKNETYGLLWCFRVQFNTICNLASYEFRAICTLTAMKRRF
jgi:hypothetical protein